MTGEQQSIICDLTVFDAATRKEVVAKVPNLFQSVQTVEELPGGYAFQFPNEPGTFMALATFVEHERQCCPFFHFTLHVPPNHAPLQLHMTGAEGVKEYMQATWSDLQGAVCRGLVHTGAEDDLDEAITRAAPVLSNAIREASRSPGRAKKGY